MAKEKKGRADGLKTVTFTLEGKRYYCYGHTLKEAKEKAEARKKELSEKRYKKSRELTFSEYFNRWTEARQGTVKGATIRKQSFEASAAEAVMIDSLGKKFGDLLLADIEVQHIRILQKQLLHREDGKERTTNTVNGIIALVSHVFHDAVNERALEWNPCNGVKPLKRTEKPARETIHRALSVEETKRFLEGAKDSAYYYLYRFLLASGCRVGEAAALTIADIKPNGIHINRTVTKTAEGYHVVGSTPKTEHGKRFIPMTESIRKAIYEQKQINKAFFGDGVQHLDQLIFMTAWGNLLIASNVERDIASICKRIGMEKFTAHAFRATFATRAIESGMNPKTLQEILGHSDIGVTMNIYAHVMESTKIMEMQNVFAV